MPLFEYQCRACGEEFEALVSSERKAECPECDSKDLEKLLADFSVGAAQSRAPSTGSCGTCGEPRGPGACQL